MNNLFSNLVRHPYRVLVLALLLSGISLLGISQLSLLTSRKALFPKQTETYQRFERYLEKFGAASDLIVVLENAPPKQLRAFADELAFRLRQQQEIRQVSEKMDLLFFLEHSYLLVPEGQLDKFHNLLEKLIGIELPRDFVDWDDALERVKSWLDDPPPLSAIDIDLKTAEVGLELLSFFAQEWSRWLTSLETPESIPWHRLVAQIGGKGMSLGDGYFTSRDGAMLFIFVRASDSSEEFEAVNRFTLKVRKIASELQSEFEKNGHSVPSLGLTGLPAVAHEEFLALQHDILFILITAGLLVLGLIIFWLRSLRWALLVFVPMGIGVLWNMGLSALTVQHLTLLTSGFTAILFGLGVDYGIFMSSRILEERDLGATLEEAIIKGARASLKPLLTAGIATALIFSALTTVSFSGFVDLGIVATTGVCLVLASTFLLQPALFVLLPPKSRTSARNPALQHAQAAKPNRSRLLSRASFYVFGLALAFALIGGYRSTSVPFDYDVLALLPKDSEAALYQRKMVAESDFQAEVVIFMAPNLQQAGQLAQAAAKLSSISRVESVTELFPEEAFLRSEKAKRIGKTVADSDYLRKIFTLGKAKLYPNSIAAVSDSLGKAIGLLEESQELAFTAGHAHLVKLFEDILSTLEKLQQFMQDHPEQARENTQRYVQAVLNYAQTGFEVLETWQKAKELKPSDLPSLLQDRFFGDDNTVAVYAFPAKSVYDPNHLDELVQQVQSLSNEVTGFPITHQVFSKMVLESFQQGTWLAAVLAALWILFMLRSWRGFLVSIVPLLLGGGWMMAIFALFDLTLNYANIIALPLVMGLAVDYGVWFGHRRHELKHCSPWQVARIAGRAILLAAGTTLAGLGAITMASYRGVASLGLSITIGLFCCVVAALMVSPALTSLLFRREQDEPKEPN